MNIRGWRKVLAVVFLVGVGVAIELFKTGGLSTNMMELLKWTGISYLGANAVKGGFEAFNSPFLPTAQPPKKPEKKS